MSAKVSIGGMRSRVGIEYATQTVDSFGQATESWSAAVYRWARVLPLAGDESDIRDGVTMRERIKIDMRGGTSLPTTARLTYRGATYQVKSMIDTDQERSMITVIAERLL